MNALKPQNAIARHDANLVARALAIVLPDGALLPRPTPLEVDIGEPLAPESASWRTAVKLRRVTRAFILSHTHEPDLEQAATGRR